MNTERDNGGNMVPSLKVKSNAADNADVILWADPTTHRLLVDANVTVDGLTAVDDSAFTAGTGTGTPIMGFATSDSVDSGDVGVVGMTTGRALFVYIKGTDVGAAGGTSMTDDAAFTPGTTAITPIGAFFDDVAPDSVNEGDAGVVRMSANRNLYVTLRDAAGNERGLNVDANGAIATTATVTGPAATDAAVSGNPVYIAGRASAAAPADVSADGDVVPLWQLRSGAVATQPTYAGVLAVAGNGASGTGVQRVTIANDSTGVLAQVNALGVGTTGPQKAEDVAFANGDMGIAVWTVRQDTLATTAANGDYVPFSSDSIGALYTRDTATLVDDAAFTPGTSRVMPVGLQADETATDSVDEGDIGTPRMTLDRKQIVAPAAHTNGGATPYKLISAASTNATSVKASAGMIYAIACFNINAAVRYLKLYNKASAPTVGTDTPVHTYAIPGATTGGGFTISIPVGMEFTTGIAFALTTEITDAGTTGVAASEIAVNIDYK